VYEKDCGLHNQNIDMIILFACLVGWLNSSAVEIQKQLRSDLQKPAWDGMNKSMVQCTGDYKGHNPWHTMYSLINFIAQKCICLKTPI